jgi:DNA-directed RNA polymerase subunit RPC12/RpoP
MRQGAQCRPPFSLAFAGFGWSNTNTRDPFTAPGAERMVSYVVCPTCHHNLAVEEGQMGRRHTCPRCGSPFLAGASAPLPGDAPPPSAPAPLNKTMLGEVGPPIRYTCPRCKKPLEDPASEAGTKKPCPYCSQRVQVPHAPAPAAGLNKTMLGQDEDSSLPQAAPLQSAALAPSRRDRCLECGRDISGWDNTFTCPDCGSVFCSSLCIREHRHHAHERRPRERPRPMREPAPEPASDNTGLVVGLVLGGAFLFIIIFVAVIVATIH